MPNENLGASFSIDVTNLKAGLAQANRLMRESQSEFQAAAAGMDDWTKSEDGLNAKIKSLNQITDIQQKKVDALKEEYYRLIADGLDPASKEAVELRTKINNETAALNKNEAELKKQNKALNDYKKENETAGDKVKRFASGVSDVVGDMKSMGLVAGISAAALKLFKKEMDELGDETEETGEEEEETAEKTLKLGDIIKANLISDAIVGGLKALANGVKAVGSAMSEALVNGAEYADNILTLSTQTGLSTDTLEKYSAVAELADVSMETFTGSLSKNVKAMGEAQKGSKKYVEAYDKLGVSVTDANGNLRDSEAVYWETVDALKGIENETERDALAMELFGKKAQDLNTIVEMGSEGFKELEQTAVDMGAVLGAEGLEALGNLDDQMQIFKSTTGATGNILASAFAPAMSTALEGINGVAGAFNGLIAAVISGDEGGIETAMNTVSEQISTMISNVSSMLPSLLDVAKNLISTLITVIVENAPLIISQGAELLGSLLNGIVSAIPKLIPVVMSVIQTLLNTILKNLPSIIKMGMEMLTALIKGIADMLPTLIPTIIDAVILMAETLLDNIDMIIDAGISLILGLADGLLTALPRLIDKIPVIIEKLITAITNNLPKLIEMGIQLTVQLAVGLIKAIPQLVSKLPQIISAIVKGLGAGLKSIVDVGVNLVKGLWDGIKNSFTWIKNKIKGWVGDVMSFIKKLFGINSPSKVMADVVGKNLALGIGVGFEKNIGAVNKTISDAMNFEDASFNVNGKGSVKNVGGGVGGLVVNQYNNFKQAYSSRKEQYVEKQKLKATLQLYAQGGLA